MKTKINTKNKRYKLKYSLKNNGFDLWRFYVNAINSETGEEIPFVFEYYVINPAVSPKEMVLGFTSRFQKNNEQLQYALTGNVSRNQADEKLVTPSFVMVRAGILTRTGKFSSRYFAPLDMEWNSRGILFNAGDGNEQDCVITENQIRGYVSVSEEEVFNQPELLCKAGQFEWNLHFEEKLSFIPDYHRKGINWSPFGAYTIFAGAIRLDGVEYKVAPKKSFGYIEKLWGRDFTSPFFHLNSSDLTSIISGRTLADSCFVVQGEFDKNLSVFAQLDNLSVHFPAHKHHNYTITYNCIEMPQDEEGIKLHWTVSIHDRNTVLDVDIFCNTDQMVMRDYECPSGNRKVMKLLCSGRGYGELRLYKRVRRNLELLEHVNVNSACCEYGNFEFPEI